MIIRKTRPKQRAKPRIAERYLLRDQPRGLLDMGVLAEGYGGTTRTLLTGAVGTLTTDRAFWGADKDGAYVNCPIDTDNGQRVVFDTVFGATTGTGLTLICDIDLPTSSTKGAFVKLGNDSTGIGMGVGNGTFDSNGNEFIVLFEAIAWRGTGQSLGTGRMRLAVAVLSDNTTVQYYKNGALVAETTSGSQCLAPSSSTYVGGYTTSGNDIRCPNARTYSFAVYNRALSAAEIEADYRRGYAVLDLRSRPIWLAISAASEGAFSSAATTTTAFTGAALASGAFASDSVATAAFTGAATAPGTFSSTATATVTVAGQALAAGPFSVASVVTPAFTGEALAAGTFTSAAGVTAAWDASGAGAGAFTSASAVTSAFSGQALAAGTYTMAVATVVDFAAPTVSSGAFTATASVEANWRALSEGAGHGTARKRLVIDGVPYDLPPDVYAEVLDAEIRRRPRNPRERRSLRRVEVITDDGLKIAKRVRIPAKQIEPFRVPEVAIPAMPDLSRVEASVRRQQRGREQLEAETLRDAEIRELLALEAARIRRNNRAIAVIAAATL